MGSQQPSGEDNHRQIENGGDDRNEDKSCSKDDVVRWGAKMVVRRWCTVVGGGR
ncbi:UDP-glycosyltransferase UGT75E2 [Sesbania bispinosa]|nr:UDP-glycosyltransferase UGT75E2 [Sesbania bispinosa]